MDTPTPTTRTSRAAVALIGLAVAALPAALASGQYAHGDGREKDANQQRGSGGVNAAARADFSAANALRAAIVTGNAPGGLSFRGDVGYAAAREFRGALGSDDLFEFRRDSLYSGLSGLGIRGTDSLQYQFALTTGSRPPPSLAGSLTVSRDSYTPITPASRPAIDRDTGNAAALTRVEPTSYGDVTGAGLWKLRSSAGYVTDRSLAESVVGQFANESGQDYGITASPLGGVRTVLVSPQAEMMRDPNAAPGNGASPAAQPLTADTSARATLSTGYDRFLDGVRDDYARRMGIARDGDASNSAIELVEEQNRKLREFLESVRANAAVPATDDAIDEAADEAGLNESDGDLNATDQMIRDLEGLGIERGALETLRDSQLRIDELVQGQAGFERNFYAIHMTEGRKLMGGGRYFEAEARFTMALSARDGDATASIARVHAQIGAGLFLSASLNLRETLTANPMLIGATYAPDLIPTPERMQSVVRRLNQSVDGEGAEARAAALLLAYVGRQLDDENLVRRGLGRIDLDGPDRLSQLLRLVWLSDSSVESALDALGPDPDEADDE